MRVPVRPGPARSLPPFEDGSVIMKVARLPRGAQS